MTRNAPGPADAAALKRIATMLRENPARAERAAMAALAVAKGHPSATLFLGIARRLRGDLPGSLEVLGPLATGQQGSAAVQYEYGVSLGTCGRRTEALATLERAVALNPNIGEAWRLIADYRMEAGDSAGADAAWANHMTVTSAGQHLSGPARAMCEGRIAEAEQLLRQHLAQAPDDPAALRMLADVAARALQWDDAAALLERCLTLAPGFTAARHSYALVLLEQHRASAALAETELLLATDPGNPAFLNLQANALGRIGDHRRATATFARVLEDYPSNPRIWMAYGDSLKTAGRTEEGIAAYRRGLELAPGFGELWWSLANLKTFRFSPADIETMRVQLQRQGAADEDRFHLHFALGKALEDVQQYEASFAHYADGNRLRQASAPYRAAATSEFVRLLRELLTPEFVVQRRGWGSHAEDPIFIVGLPRSGSTLVEQMLASHPQVEGTDELPVVAGLARELARRGPYPQVLATTSPAEFLKLGERYLGRARMYRKEGVARFIDKMPNNWLHVGLIHLMLPNARVIDVRRDPMDCCWSCFRQHFARGQHFAYSLDDLGRYYRDYVELMAHVDQVLPGRVYRVHYEELVDDTETEVRRLLDHCGLAFDTRCMQFHENARAVATASSEQVRLPIYRDAIGHWRHYEAWLAPLKDALGLPLGA
jgi:tetratricopeptide (TPR) repeat protein